MMLMVMMICSFLGLEHGSSPIPVHCGERWTASLEPLRSNAQTALAECVPAVRPASADAASGRARRCLGGSGNASLVGWHLELAQFPGQEFAGAATMFASSCRMYE